MYELLLRTYTCIVSLLNSPSFPALFMVCAICPSTVRTSGCRFSGYRVPVAAMNQKADVVYQYVVAVVHP